MAIPPLSPPSAGRSTCLIYWPLVGGLVAIVTIFTMLFRLGIAPLLGGEITTVVAAVVAGAAAGPLLLAWLWARPRIPFRASTTSLEGFWEDPETRGHALILWVLCEGATIVAAVGTLLTGSYVTVGVGAIAFALLLAHRLGVLDERQG